MSRVARAVDVFSGLAIGIAAVVFIYSSTYGRKVTLNVASPQTSTGPSQIEDVSTNNLTVPIGDDIRVTDKQKLALVEFSDFQCPFCGRYARETYPTIKREFVDTGKVAYVFKHLPLDQLHPLAARAATVAECARREGHFWELHDLFFADQSFNRDGIEANAVKVGMSAERLASCEDDPATQAHIENDKKDASRLGVRGTPTLFVGRIEGKQLRLVRRVQGVVAADELVKAINAVS